MRILVLHQNKFERMAYDRAFDHDRHEVAYAGTAGNIANIPSHIRCERFVWDGARPVTEQLRPWLRERAPFDRILARHELLIMPAAELRAEFGVPGMRPDQAAKFRDKVVMKETLARAGIRIPRFVAANDMPERAPWPGKVILKPRDANASQGVHLCDDYQSARELVETWRREERDVGRYEAEEYLAGPIWHVDGYLFRGEPVAIQSSRYIGTPLAFLDGAPVGSVQRSDPRLESWTVECLRALGADSMTFHLEAIITPEGPAFMEVAARCGGGFIVEMFRRRTGVFLHTLDMATDVDGELATRLIERPVTSDLHGMFLYPGHVFGGKPCDVPLPEAKLKEPCVRTYRVFPAGTPTPTAITYRPENLAFSGMIAGPDADALEAWLQDLFATVRVTTDG